MGLFARAATKSLLWPSLGFWPQDWHASSVGPSRPTDVTSSSALGVTAYYAGLRVLAESIASLPLITYRRLSPMGKERAPDHPAYRVLHDVANPEMTAYTWVETSVGHVVSWGNCFSEKQFDGRGRLVALWPLRPDRMAVNRDDASGALVYDYRLPSGELVRLPRSRVFHVHGLGFDGLVGYSPIEILRRTLALAQAAQEYGQRTFENDARPGVILSHPKTLSDKARANLETAWSRNHQGLTNAQRFGVLEEGITVTAIGVPPLEAQFIEARKFQTTEIARALRLPPHIIGDLDRATNNNIEQQSLELIKYSFGPWLARFESQIAKDLIPEPEVFARFLVEGFLRGDTASRYAAYHTARGDGWLNADEIREREDMNPLPDGAGQIYLAPQNMAPLDMLAEAVASRIPAPSRNGHAPEVALP